MSDLTKAVEEVRNARWEIWKRMAKRMRNHHVLAVEMFRTERNETIAVYTLVRNGEVVQEVVRGNARGDNVRAVIPRHRDCEKIQVWPEHHVEAVKMQAMAFSAADSGDVEASGIPLGEPPPQQDPEPGIVSLSNTVMPALFDVGERLTAEDSRET